MKIGMLWFDNDPKLELGFKIERAVAYYRQKYGASPTTCIVHPSMLPEDTAPQDAPATNNGKLTIRTSRSVMPDHFWIGVNGSANSEA
jgi:hypothetical protein